MIFEIDLKSAENMCVAFIGNDKNMISAFRDPYIQKHGGLHSLTASSIYNIPIEEVTKEQRAGGKRANHAFNYGYGENAFAEKYMIPRREAKHIRLIYLYKLYPRVPNGYWHFVNECLAGAMRDYGIPPNSLRNLFGKLYRFMEREGKELEHQAYSYMPQSSVAKIINTVLIELGIQGDWQEDKIPHVEKWINDPANHGPPEWDEGDGLLAPVDNLLSTHDSLTPQIDDRFGFDLMARCLKHLVSLLEVELTFSNPIDPNPYTNSWTIPAEVKAGYRLKPMTEIDMNGDVIAQIQKISETHKRLAA